MQVTVKKIFMLYQSTRYTNSFTRW